MIYWVMSVFWKACGARLLSSQRERRGLKKTTGKLLLAFVFKGNSPLVYILPGRLFLNHFPSKDEEMLSFAVTELSRTRALGTRYSAGHGEQAAPSWMRLLSRGFRRVRSDILV